MLHGTCSQFKGTAEANETYIVGGPKGKMVIVGINDREANQIDATRLPDYRGITIKPFIIDNTLSDATVYSGDSIIYSGLGGMAQPPSSRHD